MTTRPSDRIQSVTPAGHGHYAVTVEKRGKWRRAIIADTTLIDAYRDGEQWAADRLAIIAGQEGGVIA